MQNKMKRGFIKFILCLCYSNVDLDSHDTSLKFCLLFSVERTIYLHIKMFDEFLTK